MMTKDRRKMSTSGRKHVPMPHGPHTVGCVDLMTGYSKNGCFVRLYYPALPAADNKGQERLWTPWLPHDKYLNGYSQFLRVWKPIFKAMYRLTVGDIYIPAVWDAYPLSGQKMPVIIYSHGLASCRTSYSTICLEMASQGYMVAAVEHRDNSACHSYYMKKPQQMTTGQACEAETEPEPQTEEEKRGDEDEELPSPLVREWVLYKNISIKKKEYPIRNKQVRQRAKECFRVLDLLESLNNGLSVENVLDPNFAPERFKGIMDLEKVAVAGHSFGGATAILALSMELRFKVGIALDSWMLPLYNDEDVMAMVTQPMLFVNMEKFQTKENLQSMSKMESNTVDRKIVTIKGTVHLNQCDMPFVCGQLSTMVLGGISLVNRFTAMDLTTRLMLLFLGKHFKTPVKPEWSSYLDKHQKKLTEGISHKVKASLATLA